ncbi:MAG: recombinase family protein [Gammaproteobacteria bacterium]|nr:recombinase family protein [Gammaproteobacteria bacterium]
MCKLVGYVRVSTNKQATSGLGLQAQETAIDNYVKKSGHQLLKTFTEVESGKNNDRKQLKEALTYCELTGSRLVIAKLDRLSRSINFITALQDSGIKFTACDMPVANEMTIQIMSVMAQAERKAISTRTKQALSELKKQGKVLGNPNLDKAREARKNVTDTLKLGTQIRVDKANDFANKIKSIIDHSGVEGLTAIANYLNDQSIETARGAKFTPMAVKRILAR